MKIRKATPKDAKEISQLIRSTIEKVNIKDYTKRQVTALVKKNNVEHVLKKIKEREIFCLTDKGKILGSISLAENKIGGLFVRYDCLRKGIGEKLLNFIENYAKHKRIKELKLFSTKTAYKFYLGHGYKFKKRCFMLIGGQKLYALEMRKRLK